MTITIHRDVGGGVRVRRRDYAPEDFRFGSGVKVVRILRANRRKIRVRIRVDANASTGARSVRIKGETASGLFKIR